MSASGEETPPVLISLSNRPNMPQFVFLSTGSGGGLRIIQKVCTNYKKLGTLLLDDKDGNKTKIAELSHSCDPQGITYDIISDWLKRGGRAPITWATFIAVLKEIGLEPLAQDIERLAGLHQECPLHSSMDIQSNPDVLVQANVKPPGRCDSREERGEVKDDGSDPSGNAVSKECGKIEEDGRKNRDAVIEAQDELLKEDDDVFQQLDADKLEDIYKFLRQMKPGAVEYIQKFSANDYIKEIVKQKLFTRNDFQDARRKWEAAKRMEEEAAKRRAAARQQQQTPRQDPPTPSDKDSKCKCCQLL